jgi:hypothetical protein
MNKSLNGQSDLVEGRLSFFISWILPLIVLTGSFFVQAIIVRTWIWVIMLSWMGAACLLNAKKCSRTHCYYTGPFYIALAIVSFLYGYQIILLGNNGWYWLGAVLVIGTVIIWVSSETLLGKYKHNM